MFLLQNKRMFQQFCILLFTETDSSRKGEDVNNNKRKLSDLENNLLNRLTSTTGSLVDDDELIEILGLNLKR